MESDLSIDSWIFCEKCAAHLFMTYDEIIYHALENLIF